MTIKGAYSEKVSPAKARDAAQIALARAIVEQITALNKSIAQANDVGLRIDLFFTGINKTPEIREIYVLNGDKAKRIGPEVYYGRVRS